MPEKSPEQVAVEMAEKILFEMEGKKPKDVTRSEYLEAVAAGRSEAATTSRKSS